MSVLQVLQDVNISATTQLEVSNAAVEMVMNLISTESLVQVNFCDWYMVEN